MDTSVSSFREIVGNIHFMKQLQREYSFPVHVYKEDEDGVREHIRTEA